MQTLGQELGQAEPGESSGEKDQCAPERGAHGGRRLIQGISSFRKRPLHRLLASSLLNCTSPTQLSSSGAPTLWPLPWAWASWLSQPPHQRHGDSTSHLTGLQGEGFPGSSYPAPIA